MTRRVFFGLLSLVPWLRPWALRHRPLKRGDIITFESRYL